MGMLAHKINAEDFSKQNLLISEAVEHKNKDGQ